MTGGGDNIRRHDKICKSKVMYDILLNAMGEFGGERTKNIFIYRSFVKVNVVKTIIIIQIIRAIIRDIKEIR